MHKSIRKICIIAISSAIITALKFAMSGLPNIEPVTFLLMIYALNYGRPAYAVSLVFVMTEYLIYGFNFWSINYLYIWPLAVLVARLFRKIDSPVVWAVISGIYGMLFGAFCSVMYLFLPGFGATYAFAYWVSGLSFDVTHMIGNFVIMLILYRPVMTLFGRLKPYYD